ncbi:phage/plasmid primase, P4 family [Arthrobacter sp. NPDC080031]|uniref:DNA primase family protein n=1 Tax=Arthrobacter sp. NPDC080031 TaxID=3155918 RepID=UPI00344D9630
MTGQGDGPGEEMRSTGANTGGGRDVSSDPIAGTNVTSGNDLALGTAELDIITAPGNGKRYDWNSSTITWEEFCEWLDSPAGRKEAGGYVLGTFVETIDDHNGKIAPHSAIHRNKNGVVSRWAITLDADYAYASGDFEQEVKALGFHAVAHTTFSHTPENPRWRLIIPLFQSCTPEQYTTLAYAVMKKLGWDQFDHTCSQPERFFYKPSAQNGSYDHFTVDGPVATLKDLLPKDPFDRVILALEAHGYTYVQKSATELMAQCPGHPDKTPSCHVTFKDGKVLFKDFGSAQCTAEKIVKALGLEMSDLFSDEPSAALDFAVPADGWNDSNQTSHARIAARFAQYAKRDALFVNGIGWHRWDGMRWAFDAESVHAYHLLEQVRQLSWVEAQRDKQLRRDVDASMTAAGSAGVLTLASKNLFAASVDTDAWLLNTPSGTLDLHSLEIRPHNPADRITKRTGASYTPGAYEGSEFQKFLESSLPDKEVRAFLQRYAGMALIGRVERHVMVLAVGPTRAGKGVFTRAMGKMLGDYAVTANNDLLVSSRWGERKSAGDLASMMALRGARWVEMSELENGARMNESLMKTLTGGDTITAKFMARNFVEFEPSHSFFLTTNFPPTIDATSDAAWARIRVVRFDVSFFGKEDETLDDRIALELEAVLDWAIEGLRAYQILGGLAEPKAVLRANADYRKENNPVQEFVDAKCDLSPGKRTTSADLWEAYKAWAYENGETQAKEVTQTRFGLLLQQIPGVSKSPDTSVRAYLGIGLR